MGAEAESTPQGFALLLGCGVDVFADQQETCLLTPHLLSWTHLNCGNLGAPCPGTGVIMDRTCVAEGWILQVGVTILTDYQEWA